MKTIGIIGGFGPEATAQFYLKLVDASRKRNHGTQPRIVLRNVSVSARLEHDALVLGKNLDAFIPLLTHAARELERNGADIVVLPCNTLHIHENAIRESLSVPFVSLITSTVQFLRRKKISRVGLLGSRVTVDKNLFKKLANDMDFVTVSPLLQRNIDIGLDTFVETQNPRLLQTALDKSFSVFKQLAVRDVLLACTDFGGLCPDPPNIHIHDTVDILVRETVKAAE